MKGIFMRSFLVVAVLLLLNGCKNHQAPESGAEPDELPGFAHFPDTLFYGICWNAPTVDARNRLVENKFDLIDSSGTWRYQNVADSTEVLLPQEADVRAFKVCLYSQVYLRNEDKLMLLFENSASTKEISPFLSVFEYDLSNERFKLSVFVQPELIRLNFELKTHK